MQIVRFTFRRGSRNVPLTRVSSLLLRFQVQAELTKSRWSGLWFNSIALRTKLQVITMESWIDRQPPIKYLFSRDFELPRWPIWANTLVLFCCRLNCVIRMDTRLVSLWLRRLIDSDSILVCYFWFCLCSAEDIQVLISITRTGLGWRLEPAKSMEDCEVWQKFIDSCRLLRLRVQITVVSLMDRLVLQSMNVFDPATRRNYL